MPRFSSHFAPVISPGMAAAPAHAVADNIREVDISCRPVPDGRPRNPADFSVLGVLYRGSAHGYNLCRELAEQLGEDWTIPTSRIYSVLAGLERDGLVLHQRVDQESRPAKKVFSITDEGRLVFSWWLRSPVLNVRDIPGEFLAKLYFARLESPSALVYLIANQLSVFRDSMERLVNTRQFCKTDTERAEVDYRLAVLNAAEIWLYGLSEAPHLESKGRFGGPPYLSRVRRDPASPA